MKNILGLNAFSFLIRQLISKHSAGKVSAPVTQVEREGAGSGIWAVHIEDGMEARIQGYRVSYEEMSRTSKAVDDLRHGNSLVVSIGYSQVSAHETQVAKLGCDQGFCFFV